MKFKCLLYGMVFTFLSCNLNTAADQKKAEEDAELRKTLIALVQSIPSCQTNSTGTVYFLNTSNTNRTYDILWDGVVWATVTPNGRSSTFTVASGIHTLLFRVTNTSTQACTPSTPNIAICSNTYYYCSG